MSLFFKEKLKLRKESWHKQANLQHTTAECSRIGEEKTNAGKLVRTEHKLLHSLPHPNNKLKVSSQRQQTKRKQV